MSIPAKPGQLAHDQDVEWRALAATVGQGGEQSGEARSIEKLSAADVVVAEDVVLGDLPPLPLGVSPRLLNLRGTRLVLLRPVVVIVRFSAINRGCGHRLVLQFLISQSLSLSQGPL